MSNLPKSTTDALDGAFSHAPCGVALVDAHARVVFVNAQAGLILGERTSALCGRDLAVLLRTQARSPLPAPRPDIAPLERLLLVNELEQGMPLSFEALDGTHRHVRVSAGRWAGPEGEPGAIVYLFDETEQQEANRARHASEEALMRFLEGAPEPALIHDAGRIVIANPAVARALGYDRPDDVVGKSIYELTHPRDLETVRERVRLMLETHQPQNLREERFLRKDGSVFTAEVFALPVMIERRVLILAWGRDLTPFKEAEEERKRLLAEQMSEREEAQRRSAELQGILDNMLAGLFVCDAQGVITLTNPLGAELVGYKDVYEVIGLHIEKLLGDFDLRHIDSTPIAWEDFALRRALDGETVPVQDTAITRADGHIEHYFRSSAGPIRNAQGEVVAAVEVFRDITDVIEFNRLKDQFLRVVAHELKTPVAVMKGYAELMSRNPQAAKRIDAVSAIRRGADRIDRIVNDMASLSALLENDQTLDVERLRLDELVANVVDGMRSGLKKHRIEVDLAPIEVSGDFARLEQVVHHLIDNAVRYSPKGGVITVCIRPIDRRVVQLSVHDQGVGIPADKQRRIYQRFYRAHTDTPYDYGGLGIGLSLSKELIELHGGRMWFESEEGVGSTFTMELPCLPH